MAALPVCAALAVSLWASPSPGQTPGGTRDDAALQLRHEVLAAMESLREEIATLQALRDAQEALLAWNRGTPRYRESGNTGEAPASLPAALCEHPAIAPWCPLLPATFGTSMDGEGQ